ncbi:ras guanine nucleotide exchange factor domain-containing protein [Sphaerosporella brunnea]|uniref:Ras guanine nucleotide exchange factor domain-containing protein n=1 Tax=Sphaerosporella brunnea TaxID=1250544 RepID=A0A5J5ESL4_9PEZI|nr:ras guanine nucleotide exchange factor domain-containing protein [Sphaerosporella brunnea]
MSTVRDINIAVVGAAGVGKTTFIERAYDLKAPTRHGEVHSLTLVVDRAPCSVSLVEVDWDRIDFEKEVMKWPRVTDGQRIPFIDGVLLLYDPANPSTCSRVSECLESFDKAQLPVCLVRTKGDVPGGAFEATTTISGADGYERLQTSLTARDSQKKCMAAILALISRRNEKSPRYLNRRRANSSAANSRAASPRPSTGHNRASSEFSSTFLNDRLSDTGSIHGPARLQRPPASVASGQSLNIPGPISSSPLSSADPRKNSTFTAPQITLSSSGQTHSLDIVATNPFSMQQTSSQSSLGDPERPHPYIDTDDDDSTGFKDPDDIPILDREDALDELDEEDKPILNRGWNWDELVNRLLSQPMSRSDMIFVTIFLCFYRKFAAPRELLDAILERFKAIEHEEKFRALRIAIQLRYCNVLHQWVSSHPGDFSNPKTKKQLLAFLDSISTDRSLALLAADMTKLLQAPAEDEDDRWGRTDVDMDRPPSIQSFLTESSPTFPDCTTKAWQLSLDNPSTQLQIPGEKMTPEFDAVSPLTMGSAMGLTISKTEPLPPPSTPVTKPGGQYELFMNISITEVANELTRIDWSEFSRIRPRDLVRHINVSAECRENSPSLAPVNNMISHFNHVAYWVASVILEKPKPKHRAKALEKFMEIAWTLRHMNNYNSLGAIIAGINGTAIHRLNQTRELVNPEINKKFMRLELLMGTHKSHSKYRLAWENTTSERIPFLPLHRRDLVSAEEGNKTLLQDGEKINWSKFQIMGDVMMVLVKAQGMPYKNLEGNSTVATMISNAATTMNDDELYERSVQLEGSATSGGNKPRRNWFQLNQRA